MQSSENRDAQIVELKKLVLEVLDAGDRVAKHFCEKSGYVPATVDDWRHVKQYALKILNNEMKSSDAEESATASTPTPEPENEVEALKDLCRVLQEKIQNLSADLEYAMAVGNQLVKCARQLGSASASDPKWVNRAEIAVKLWEERYGQ